MIFNQEVLEKYGVEVATENQAAAESTLTIVEKMTDEQVRGLSKNEYMVLQGTCRRAIVRLEEIVWDERDRQDKIKLMTEGI